jgi:hypothetical protein
MHANILQSYKNQLSLQKERQHMLILWIEIQTVKFTAPFFQNKNDRNDRIFINLSFWTKIKNEAY